MVERITQLRFEGDDWHPETENTEQYYAYCSVCEWQIKRPGPEEEIRLTAQGHENMTGHHVLLQGESHYDTEPV
jgi:hypothetical protein